MAEPVGEWLAMKNADGESLLALFYRDKKRWAYTFQNAAILTRLTAIRNALDTTTKRVIITERSVLTDRFVFADMLRESGDLDALEWQLYMRWFDSFAAQLPIKGIIYLTTGVSTSKERITTRGRDGGACCGAARKKGLRTLATLTLPHPPPPPLLLPPEDAISQEYLGALDAQHAKWVEGTHLPVLKLCTEAEGALDGCVAQVAEFVQQLLAMPEAAGEGGGKGGACATPVATAGGSPLKACRE